MTTAAPPAPAELLEAALSYAARGWRVLPVHSIEEGRCTCGKKSCSSPGKHPRSKNGSTGASANPDVVRRWWSVQWPTANVAIATGQGSGICVVDLDGEDGMAAWRSLTKDHDLPDTVEAVTGGGGGHLLYGLPPGLKIGNRQKLVPGVDIRGEGGYIVAAPSFHLSGRRYEWSAADHPEDRIPADLPDWLIELLRSPVAEAGPVARSEADQQLPPAPLGPILQGCGWLAHCVEDAATLPEAQWYGMLTIVARCESGHELGHTLSAPHPKYTHEETAKKINHALDDTGPMTCQSIRASLGGEEYCSKCPSWGRIKSPISIGRDWVVTAEPPPGAGRSAGEFEDVPFFSDTPNSAAGLGTNGHHTPDPFDDEVPVDPDDNGALSIEDLEDAERPSSEKDSGPSDLILSKSWATKRKHNFAFFEGSQWWEYRGGRWEYTSTEYIEAQAQLYLEGYKHKGKKIGISARRPANVIRLARAHLGVHKIKILNAHPTWIPLRNGVYDSETASLLPHSPTHWLTYQLPFDYDPQVVCPRWMQFLDETLIGEDGQPLPEWHDIMQEWFGYCLVADNRAQLSMVWVGEGRNGKGVAARALEGLVGRDQCTAVVVDQLHDPYHRADLHSKLVGFINEPDRRSMLKNGSYFKALTGGDTISARRPTEKVFSWVPSVRFVISTNTLPATDDFTKAYFRRVTLIEFRREFTGETVDRDLDAKLQAELPGIFNWAVAGLARLRSQDGAFTYSPESARLVGAYRLGEDSLQQFIEGECERERDYEVRAADFYTAYCAWCTQNGFRRPDTSNAIGRRLEKAGHPAIFARRTDWVGRVRQGIRIRPGSAFSGDENRTAPPETEQERLPYAD